MTDRTDAAERTEAAEANAPIDRTEAYDPIEPTDNAEPTDPMDRTEFFDHRHSREFSDRKDHFELRFLVMSTIMAERGRLMPRDSGRKLIASNKKARHDYAILKTYEAGLVLAGTEVKALRDGHASLVDAFAQEHEGEIMLYNLHIAEYGFGSWTNHVPRRTRKLLLHRVEIDRILDKLRDGNGLTLVPLTLYFAGGWAKVELGLARGLRSYDKRQVLAARDAQREIAREMGRRLKGRPG